MNTEFSGLTAVVTGAGSGIGLEVAKNLTQYGATVFGLDLHKGDLDGHGTWIECNIGESDSVKTAFENIATHTQVIDILINNAGISAVGTVEDATDAEWYNVLNVNVAGMGRVSAAALPFLRKSSCGAIVNTCSIAATSGLPKRAVYGASKGAVLALTYAMAVDLIKEKIRVNCVNPGTADTPWVARLLANAADPVSEKANLEGRQPMGRLVTAAEVASAILYLASPRQSSTTGTALPVDGGLQTLRLPR